MMASPFERNIPEWGVKQQPNKKAATFIKEQRHTSTNCNWVHFVISKEVGISLFNKQTLKRIARVKDK